MKNILCYGDSNTHGQIGGTEERFSRDIRWTGRLQKLLGGDYYIIEEGLPGRTTVWDDPIEEHKNGKKYLLPCLASHRPLDLVVLVLGTNDLKLRFSVSPFDIGESARNLINAILSSKAGYGFEAPRVLLVVPAPIKDVGNDDFNNMLEGGIPKSLALAAYYKRVAEDTGVDFLEPGNNIELSGEDGVHYTEAGHEAMADILAGKIREILQ